MTPGASKIVWLGFCVVWFIQWVRPHRRAHKTPVQYSARDWREIILLSCSLTGLGIVPIAYVSTGFPRFADYTLIPAQAYLGIAVFCGTLWLMYRAHRELGRNWSLSLELRDRHTLVTTGVYANVRHPIYSGYWLMAIAQLLMLPNWIAGPAGMVGFGTLFFSRVGREEQMMINAFGDEYRDYMRRTARVMPWIF
jgi:protein-S-isoprenylcysteine O-methyltransferase Ste14